MNLISVVLPVKNNAAVLPNLLADLKQQNYQNFEVIFVDNNSVDQTYQQLVAFKRLSGIPTTIISQRIRQSIGVSYNQSSNRSFQWQVRHVFNTKNAITPLMASTS